MVEVDGPQTPQKSLHVNTHTHRCKHTESGNILQPNDTNTLLLHGSEGQVMGGGEALHMGVDLKSYLEDITMATVTMEVRNAT